MPHTNVHQKIDFPAGQSRTGDEGIYLHDLADGAVVEIETQHHHCRLVKGTATRARISGHPTICPEPVEVEIEGSFGSRPRLMPNPGFIGRGMYLVFKHPRFNQATTSRIREIHKLD
jgi:hypothetical protein